MTTKLLKSGCVLSFDDETQSVKVLEETSILIVGDEITAIGNGIKLPSEVEIVDLTGKVVTPGFINTHSHMWQTAHRTLGPNTTLAEYMFSFSPLAPIIKSYSAEDVYTSCLAGYYEGLNAGVTGYVEHAHNNWELDVVKRGWNAAVDGGARVWWCPNIEDREGCSQRDQLDFMRTLGDRTADNHPLVSLGFAYDRFSGSPPGDIERTKEDIRKLHLEAITLHCLGGPWPVGDASPSAVAEANLQELNIPVVFSHGGFVTESDRNALREHDWNLSITPESEMHYGHGQQTSRLIQDQGSLGVDTNWTFSGDILTQSRLWLQKARDASYKNTLDKGLIPQSNPMSVEDALLMATRQGGRAVRRNDIGVLKVGAKADLVVFDGDSPNMLGWTDPVAAVVLHANVGDIEHVIVGGEFRKRDRQLVLRENGWPTFSKRFKELTRRVQEENITPPPMPNTFFGAEFGEVDSMSTIRPV